MAGIPRPTGLTGRPTPGWGYITVPRKNGYGQELEHDADGDWKPATKPGTEWLVPIRQYLTTKIRARYTRSGQAGPWTTGRINDEGFEEDGAPKPAPPVGLHATAIGGDWTMLDWQKPATDPDAYQIAWRKQGQKHWTSRRVVSGEIEIVGGACRYTLRNLARYAQHDVSVAAVVGQQTSDPAAIGVHTTGRADELPGPADPANATADAVTDTTCTILWDQDDPAAVKYWQVSVQGHAPTETVEEQEHTFTGLDPATGYTAFVWAVGHDLSYAAGAAEVGFTTTDGGGSPFPKPPAGLRVVSTDPDAGTATVGWDTAADAEFWRVLLEDVDPVPRTARRNQLVFRGLEHGRRYGWRVRAVRTDDEGHEYESVWVRGPEFELDGEQPVPEPPAGLEVHCISDRAATATWDQDEAVDCWRAWLDERQPGGELETYTPGVKLTELDADTDYTVSVAAVVGGTESQPAALTFTTLATIDPPQPPPPPDIGADLPAPAGLMVRADSATAVTAWWTDGRPDKGDEAQFYLASIDGVYWDRLTNPTVTFTDLQPGIHTVHVYGVVGKKLTGIARASATTKAGA